MSDLKPAGWSPPPDRAMRSDAWHQPEDDVDLLRAELAACRAHIIELRRFELRLADALHDLVHAVAAGSVPGAAVLHAETLLAQVRRPVEDVTR